jgi:transposase
MIYEGTANSEVMLTYFENLLPKLPKSSVIIMDNESLTKVKSYKIYLPNLAIK